MMFVKERFILDHRTQDYLHSLIPQFGYNGYGEFVFYRTYSRIKYDGGQEDWADTVIRNVEGTFSIRKDWYIKNHIAWDETWAQKYAYGFAEALYRMQWMPPGRGLWAMGSDFIYERGSMSLYNCGYSRLDTISLPEDLSWLMDCLMQGVGVGFSPERDDYMELYNPIGTFEYIIPDSREGWTESVRLLCAAFTRPNQLAPQFKYHLIRKEGSLIKGFGGICSGPAALVELHTGMLEEFYRYRQKPQYDSVYLKTNLANRIGVCVVAGNVRRSAELAKGKINDSVFMDLKDYNKFPERAAFGWLSNNSVELLDDTDFDHLDEIAKRVILNGEPGYINRQTMRDGRIGKSNKHLREDKAEGLNPCSEIPLENKELCNLAGTYPTVCSNHNEWIKTCEYAAFYSTTVSLLPTNSPESNKIIARNRRIGVGIVDITGWKLSCGLNKIIKYMRQGYKKVVETACYYNNEAGIPHPIRFTSIQPGGTTPKLQGKTSVIGHPTFHYTLRRTNIGKNSPLLPLIEKANIPYEQSTYDKNSVLVEWPILQGPAKPASEISVWEQAFNVIVMQREWSDNAVSNTLYFKPKWQIIEYITENFEKQLSQYFGLVEACGLTYRNTTLSYLVPERYKAKFTRDEEGDLTSASIYEYDPNHEEDCIEAVLSAIAPLTKSVSLLPHSNKGAYKQMPEEGISEEEYYDRLSVMQKIDWSELSGSDGQDEKYCFGDACTVPLNG